MVAVVCMRLPEPQYSDLHGGRLDWINRVCVESNLVIRSTASQHYELDMDSAVVHNDK